MKNEDHVLLSLGHMVSHGHVVKSHDPLSRQRSDGSPASFNKIIGNNGIITDDKHVFWVGCVALRYNGLSLREIEVKQRWARLVPGWVTVTEWGVLMQPTTRYRMTPGVRHSGIVNWLILVTYFYFICEEWWSFFVIITIIQITAVMYFINISKNISRIVSNILETQYLLPTDSGMLWNEYRLSFTHIIYLHQGVRPKVPIPCRVVLALRCTYP